ncbi:MAG: SDR family NAD(P)-dependent oxidoreductase [Defluviicoccus sp.]|nr:SDR family NAD(P)-dependent oxidoreductase [Defluviicoccus sp.]MDE0383990.1 SDR family NAD(P)-dependent oxidoreductase [Defluviicoccus sp.]
MSRRELESKAAIVTGSVRGIGRAIALAFADAGASVTVNGRRSAEAAREIAGEIEAAGGRARIHLADVSDPDQAQGLVEETVAAFGRLDILVNNVSHRIARPVGETSYEEWRDVQANTVDSAFLCIRSAVPHLIAAGGGSIVNIGGVSGHRGVKNRAAVAAAKAGLAGMTAALAVELAPDNINVNCVSPGSIDNYEASGHVPAHFRDNPIPMGRMGTVREIAAMVRHLCGPEGRYVAGQTIHVCGAWNVSIA